MGVRGVAFSPDGKWLATGDHNGEVKIWDRSDPQQPRVIRTLAQGTGKRIEHMRFSIDGKILAIIGRKFYGSLILWSTEAHKEIITIDIGIGRGVAFSPDDKLVASGETVVTLWDRSTRKAVATPDGHKGAIMSIAFSPDGRTLATASLDHTVKLWSIEIGQEVATLKGHRGPVSGLAFSRDGTLLVSSSEDKTIRLWRADSENVFSPTVR
jgi:WD40 repeat protein